MSNDSQSSYKQIIKATSIFGSVQILNILIAIIRSKAVALLLGTAGMGILGLLTSTSSLISSLTNFGLRISAIRNISEAYAENDEMRIAKTTSVFRKLVWITGSLGALLSIILSPLLSEITFGNKNYTLSFVLLSVSLLLGQLTDGQNVILQGTRRIKYLASANIFSSLSSLAIALPLYYFLGIEGIVPVIVIMGFFGYLIALYYSRKVFIRKISVTLLEMFSEGKSMLKLGFILSLSGLAGTLVSYLVRIYIGNYGNLDDVGLYSAGFQIIGTYVGLIFTAMGTDYFPRLTLVANDDFKSKTLVNQQGEMAILIIGPIVLLFIICINWLLFLLYSDKFVMINEMMRWAALGMFFKAASWPIGYIFLAKGDSTTFLISEIFAHAFTLIFNLLGYKFFGLSGLGISFLISYLLVFFQVYLIAYFKYDFEYLNTFFKLFLVQIFFSIFAISLSYLNIKPLMIYAILISSIVFSIIHSIRELNIRLLFFKN